MKVKYWTQKRKWSNRLRYPNLETRRKVYTLTTQREQTQMPKKESIWFFEIWFYGRVELCANAGYINNAARANSFFPNPTFPVESSRFRTLTLLCTWAPPSMAMTGEVDPRTSTFSLLPEGCVAKIMSLTSPEDACRAAAVSLGFKSAADCDVVWERFLPHNFREIASRAHSPLAVSSKKQLYFLLHDSALLLDEGKLVFSFPLARYSCYLILFIYYAIMRWPLLGFIVYCFLLVWFMIRN